MEPPIQYARTTDGVNIAFTVYGTEGPTLVWMSSEPHGHLRLTQRIQPRLHERLCRSLRIVHYDGRGCGYSQRTVDDVSLDARVRDLEAVIDGVGVEDVMLFASGMTAPAALRYAADHGDRVRWMLLLNPSINNPARFRRNAQTRALLAMALNDWDTYLETFSRMSVDWTGADAAPFREMLREHVTPEMGQAYLRESERFDASDWLPRVQAAVHIIHHSRLAWVDNEDILSAMAGLRNAALHVVDSSSFWPNEDETARLVEEFMGLPPGDKSTDPALAVGDDLASAIILFADIVDSTALTERMGDAAFRERSRLAEIAVREAIRRHGGKTLEGKVLGDGVMATFQAAKSAIDAAIACREGVATTQLQLHVGIHAGDVIREPGNVYGGAVNLASRIQGASSAGEILVSEVVRALARTSAGVTFEDRGEHLLKGIEEPQHLWAVHRS